MTNSPKQPTDCLEKEAKLVDCSETEMYFFAIFFDAAPHLPSKQNYKIEIHLHIPVLSALDSFWKVQTILLEKDATEK